MSGSILSYASSLCGACTEACPVKINLHELLLENRHEAVEEGHSLFTEKMAWKMWKQGMLRRKWMNMASGGVKNWVVNTMVKGWKHTVVRWSFQKNHLMNCGRKRMRKNKSFSTRTSGRERFILSSSALIFFFCLI